jgi:uncharacterized protein involved in exopolysaccharide biosynthesis
MAVDPNLLIRQLGAQIGDLIVQVNATRLELDVAQARVTELEGEKAALEDRLSPPQPTSQGAPQPAPRSAYTSDTVASA